MTDTKISALSSAGTLAGTEKLPVVSGGVTKAALASDVVKLALPFRWFRVKDYGAVLYQTQAAALAGTDSTSAIQAAIDACYAAGGGTVEFEPGYYKIAGSLGDGSVGQQYSRAQIRLPYSLCWNPVVCIRLYCHEPACTLTAGSTQGGGGATLVSTLTGQTFTPANAVPSVIGGPAWVGTHTLAGGSGSGQFTALFLLIDGIGVRTQQNPTLTAFDFSGIFACICQNYRADTVDAPGADSGYPPTHITQPTHPWAVGMICPQNNNNCINTFGSANIQGYYLAFFAGENTHQEGILSIFSNWQSIGLNFNYHPCTIGPRVSAYGNHFILAGWYPDVGTYDLDITVFDMYIDIEDHPIGWEAPDTTSGHIKDGNSAARGIFKYNHSMSGSGYNAALPFYMTGGRRLKKQEMSQYHANPEQLFTDGGTARLLNIDYVGETIFFNNSSAVTLTVPSDTTDPQIPLGGCMKICQYGTGQITFVLDTGVTMRSSGGKTKTIGQYSFAELRKIGANLWILSGDITT